MFLVSLKPGHAVLHALEHETNSIRWEILKMVVHTFIAIVIFSANNESPKNLNCHLK